VVLRCLQNMALSIMTKLYNGLWVFQANLSSYKHITLKEKYNSSEIAHECYEEHLYIQSGIDNCDKLNYWFHFEYCIFFQEWWHKVNDECVSLLGHAKTL
jgi:hypothetical protein